MKTYYRSCNLCEAICGLAVTIDKGRIVSIKGDDEDPLSKGYICPKATALADLQEDPDRIKRPIRREGDSWVAISWDEAYREVAMNCFNIQRKYGSDAVATYVGNPAAHNYGTLLHNQQFFRLLNTRNRFSGTSVDHLAQLLVLSWMYGHPYLSPIPDIDHCDFLLIIGANPMVSNGSMMTSPNLRKRLKSLKERGGKLITVDPRRTETANIANQHLFVRPGGDAYFLLAMVNILFEENLIRLGSLGDIVDGIDQIRSAVKGFTPELAEQHAGIVPDVLRQLVREFAAAQRAVCYGRMGVSTQRHATVCLWAIQVLNLLTGNIDTRGGCMFSLPAVEVVKPGRSRQNIFNRWQSRVSGLPEFNGELPSSILAEEISTPGHGQIRALVTCAANPVLSTPNGRQLDKALDALDYMVSIDFYINETTRHADIILPPTCTFEHDHYDIGLLPNAVRNVAKYNPAILDKPDGAQHDWEIFNSLGEHYAALKGVDYERLREPAELIDQAIAGGAYGCQHEMSLSLEKLVDEFPHGVDLGPLNPDILRSRLRTNDGRIHAGPEEILSHLNGLRDEPIETGLRLIGRRHVRCNNSWMHNFNRLVKGKARNRLLVNPKDLKVRGLMDGDKAVLTSRIGREAVLVESSEDMMPGTVSLPHGWGHSRTGVKLAVASKCAGVSANDLTDEKCRDPLSGVSALNGTVVDLQPAP